MSKSKKSKSSTKPKAVQEEIKTTDTSAEQPVESKEPKISKKALMIDMLKRPEGASIEELMKATGWLKHSVRGALVNLKNRDKLPVTSSKDEGDRRYRLEEQSTKGGEA